MKSVKKMAMGGTPGAPTNMPAQSNFNRGSRGRMPMFDKDDKFDGGDDDDMGGNSRNRGMQGGGMRGPNRFGNSMRPPAMTGRAMPPFGSGMPADAASSIMTPRAGIDNMMTTGVYNRPQSSPMAPPGSTASMQDLSALASIGNRGGSPSPSSGMSGLGSMAATAGSPLTQTGAMGALGAMPAGMKKGGKVAKYAKGGMTKASDAKAKAGAPKANPFAKAKAGAPKANPFAKAKAPMKFAKGGSIDGCAVKGKTKGKMVTMKRNG